MNVKSEFILHIGKIPVLCVYLEISGRETILTTGYTPEEFSKFLDSIDTNYDSGYGSQELFGTIWYKDGTWSSRGEYDGSEWWYRNVCPPIPDALMRIDKVREEKINQIL